MGTIVASAKITGDQFQQKLESHILASLRQSTKEVAAEVQVKAPIWYVNMSGVLKTEWYTPPGKPNDRLRITVLITSRTLRSDSFAVSIERQERSPDGGWKPFPAGAGEGGGIQVVRARVGRPAGWALGMGIPGVFPAGDLSHSHCGS